MNLGLILNLLSIMHRAFMLNKSEQHIGTTKSSEGLELCHTVPKN